MIDDVPGRRWEIYTIIAGLRDSGVIAPMVLQGAMNTDALRTRVQQSLAPQLEPWDIVVWDNLSIHNCPEIADIIRERGARLEFLPPYSPDMNPI